MQKSISNLEEKYNAAREAYGDFILESVELLNIKNITELRKRRHTEKLLFKKCEALREKLVGLIPEKYHFGKILKSDYSLYSQAKNKYSRFGDEGYILCKSCDGLFKHRGEHKDGKTADCFLKCWQHRGRKSIGTLKPKWEELR